MEKEIDNFNEEKFRESANLILVKLLLKILYDKNNINKKEYETITNKINRTSNY